MNVRRFAAELSAIVVCAALCATVSNLLAGRERRLSAVGSYPAALTLPKAAASPAPEPVVPAAAPPSASAPVSAAGAPGPSAAPLPGPKAPKGAGAIAAPAAPAPAPAAPALSAAARKAELLARFPAHPDRPFVEISGEEALWAHARGVPFLDARRSKVYEEGHVAGARSFAVWEADVDQKVFAFQDEAARELPVVLYCSGGECEDSHMLADKLFGAGFTDVLVYRDGWPDWVKRGGASRAGPTP